MLNTGSVIRWYLYTFVFLCTIIVLRTNDASNKVESESNVCSNFNNVFRSFIHNSADDDVTKRDAPILREPLGNRRLTETFLRRLKSSDGWDSSELVNVDKRLFKGTEPLKVSHASREVFCSSTDDGGFSPLSQQQCTFPSNKWSKSSPSSSSSSQFVGDDTVSLVPPSVTSSLDNVSSTTSDDTFQLLPDDEKPPSSTVTTGTSSESTSKAKKEDIPPSQIDTEEQSVESQVQPPPSSSVVEDSGVHEEISFSAGDQQHEDIPSFREWTEKHLAEEEKEKGEEVTNSSAVTAKRKVQNKNFASPDCGAKVLATNAEAKFPGNLLSPSRDEYLLSACNSRIWFVVELCEAVQVKRIELANFELFSSSPKEFTVSVADRYPSREWMGVGQFVAKDEKKSVQSFHLNPHHFTKHIRVDIHSHYGKEHFCPISLFRVYGTSELEVLETVDDHHGIGIDNAELDPDEEELTEEEAAATAEGAEKSEKPESSGQNIFDSARDAVISIVKKAAEVLVVKSPSSPDEHTVGVDEAATASSITGNCITPRYSIFCSNCTKQFFHRVFDLVSCKTEAFVRLSEDPFIRGVFDRYNVCCEYGVTFGKGLQPSSSSKSEKNYSYPHPYPLEILPQEFLVVVCNMMAISRNVAPLNTTYLQWVAKQKQKHPTDIYATTDVASGSVITDPMMFKIVESSEERNAGLPTRIKPTKTLDNNVNVMIDGLNETTSAGAETNGEQTKSHLPLPTPTLVKKATEFTDPVSPEGNQSGGSRTFKESDQSGEAATEDSMSLDSLISELERTANGSQNVTSSASVSASSSSKPQVQKESVFVRLANRIKALERNMSLSGQYLEELSRRYKKQVEDMQRLLSEAQENKQKTKEREERHAQDMNLLMQQIASLTIAVDTLLSERQSWTYKAWCVGEHSVIVMLEIFLLIVLMCLCRGVPKFEISRRKISLDWTRKRTTSANSDAAATVMRRRHSENDILKDTQKVLKRRPSVEALRMDGSAHQDLLISGTNQNRNESRRRRRKRKELILRLKENSINLEAGGNMICNVSKRKKFQQPMSRCVSAIEITHPSNTSNDVICENSENVAVVANVKNKRATSAINETASLSTADDVSLDRHSTSSIPSKEKRVNSLMKIVKKIF